MENDEIIIWRRTDMGNITVNDTTSNSNRFPIEKLKRLHPSEISKYMVGSKPDTKLKSIVAPKTVCTKQKISENEVKLNSKLTEIKVNTTNKTKECATKSLVISESNISSVATETHGSNVERITSKRKINSMATTAAKKAKISEKWATNNN